MAHSPDSPTTTEVGTYARNWDALGALIASGKSFSGRERNVAFLNMQSPDVSFACASGAVNLDQIDDSRTVIPADWDNDGDLDLWYANRTAPRLRFLRNDLSLNGHWLTLTLEGRAANRDAVGTRAELTLRAADGTERNLWRRVKAGDGFLSQTPKSLHFAFRADETITKLLVRWPAPGRALQEITGIEANARWKITEDAPAVRLERSRLSLQSTPAAPPKELPLIRAPLVNRVPLGSVPFLDTTGKSASLSGPLPQPVLVVFWGSWCARCAAEMKDLATHASELKSLRLLALAVDTATPTAGQTDVDNVRRALADRPWPFESGFATQATLSALVRAEASALYPERALELPSAYLIDPDGRLSVIYHGPVSPVQLIKDAAFARSAPKEVEAAVFPFPGRNARSLLPAAPFPQAQALREAGDFEGARELLRRSLEATPAGDGRTRLALLRRLADTEDEAGRPEAAVVHWNDALVVSPSDAALHLAAAASAWRAGRKDDALAAIAKASSLAQEPAGFQNSLGKVWQALGEQALARDAFAASLAADPDRAETSFNLAVASQMTGQTARAIEHYQIALKLDPSLLDARSNLAWVLATTKNDALRDPDRAVALASEVNAAARGESPAVLDTLAAAMAAAGDFPAATTLVTQALTLARATGDHTLAAEISARLQSYTNRQPWRE